MAALKSRFFDRGAALGEPLSLESPPFGEIAWDEVSLTGNNLDDDRRDPDDIDDGQPFDRPEDGQADSSDPDQDNSVDPLRLYLKDMARHPLISREEEVFWAKRLEDGDIGVLVTLVKTPYGLMASRP
jgi:hypothetical protein